MKINTTFLIAIMAICIACGGDHNEPSEEDIFMSKLCQTWNTNAVTVDGLDVTNDFAGMTITFDADNHYTTTHAVPPIWPASGTFTLQKSGSAYEITRDDGTGITILELTDKSITFSFQYTHAGARINNVSGKYQFVMGR